MTINDHYFGHDDRVLVPVNEAPWRYMGVLRMDNGGACSATLVAPDVIATAAHCIHGDSGLSAAGRFSSASGDHEARITAYLIDRRFDVRRFNSTDEIDGLEWALLRLDQPLGNDLGYAGIQNLTGRGGQVALATDIMQPGFSWDTVTQGTCRVRLDHSAFVYVYGKVGRKVDYMFTGWFAGAMDQILAAAGSPIRTVAELVQSAAEEGCDHGLFVTRPIA